MIGLIRNNFYSVMSSLKLYCLLAFVLSIISSIGIIFYNTDAFSVILVVQISFFALLIINTLQKDAPSKWNRFELTLPVKRADVIKAKYISIILYDLIGVAFATLTMAITYITSPAFDFENTFFFVLFGLSYSLIAVSIAYPLVLKFGTDKAQLFSMLSVAFSVGIILLTLQFFERILGIDSNIPMLLVSIPIFIVSFLISINIHKKMDL